MRTMLKICAAFATAASIAPAQSGAAAPEFFETKIRPILANNCYSCHTNSQLAGLRVDSRAALLKGGQSGPAVVAGDAEKACLSRPSVRRASSKCPKAGS